MYVHNAIDKSIYYFILRAQFLSSVLKNMEELAAVIPMEWDSDYEKRNELKVLSNEQSLDIEKVKSFVRTLKTKECISTLINTLRANEFKTLRSEYLYSKTAEQVGLWDSRLELARLMQSAMESMYGR